MCPTMRKNIPCGCKIQAEAKSCLPLSVTLKHWDQERRDITKSCLVHCRHFATGCTSVGAYYVAFKVCMPVRINPLLLGKGKCFSGST